MLPNTQIKANKLWSDVMKGEVITFKSPLETRAVSLNKAYASVLESKLEDIISIIKACKDASIYIKFEAMKLVMEELIEAIEDFDDE